jgi:hypothetical protein
MDLAPLRRRNGGSADSDSESPMITAGIMMAAAQRVATRGRELETHWHLLA